MARRKAGTKQAESENQGTPSSEQAEAANGKPLTKVEAIRRALAAGFEMPQEGTAYIRKEFGVEVTLPQFSTTKSQIKKREGGKKPGRKPKATVEGYLASPPAGDSRLLDAIEAMKPLVASLGVDQVKRIADLLS